MCVVLVNILSNLRPHTRLFSIPLPLRYLNFYIWISWVLCKLKALQVKICIFVCVDDFSRFTWVSFIREKSDTFDSFKDLCMKLKNEKNCNIVRIVRIRVIMERIWKFNFFLDFCNKYGISHEFSSPKTPQYNGVIKRKNCTL